MSEIKNKGLGEFHLPQGKRNKTNSQQIHNQQLRADDAFILSSTTTLHRHTVIAKLEVMQAREDLQEILIQHKNNIGDLPSRFRDYTKKLGLVSSDSEITDKGYEFIENGVLAIPEKGVYDIWYCNHPLVGNKPIAIQRIDAFKNQLEGSVLGRDGDTVVQRYLTSERILISFCDTGAKEGPEIDCKIKSIDVIAKSNTQEKAALTWYVENDKLELCTNIPIRHKKYNQPTHKRLDIDFPLEEAKQEEAWKAIAKVLGGNWSDKQEIELPLTPAIDQYEILNDFMLNKLPEDIQNIEVMDLNFKIENFPPVGIKPTEEAAEDWRNAWIKHYYAETLTSPRTADRAQLAWRSKPQLKNLDLEALGPHAILQLLQEKGRDRAFWNAASTMDLVTYGKKSIGLPLHLMENEHLEPQDLLSRLTDRATITRMVISDRYFKTEAQGNLLHAISHSISKGQKNLLITNKNSDKNLPEGWEVQYFERKLPENHDRYWVLYTPNDVRYWKVSTGLDFLRRETEKWIVKGCPTFTPLDKANLPKFINKIIGVNE